LVLERLELLTAEITACRRCPRLVEWRERVAREKRAAYCAQEYWGLPVPGFGDPAARLLVVGLAPAAHGGNRTGRAFTCDNSGDWVYGALHRAGFANQPTSTDRADGLALQGAYISSPVRCAPPGNKPLPSERDACAGFFQREVALLPQLRVVVPLGAFAYEATCKLLDVQPRPKFGHGLEVAPATGPRILCSYHPSQHNTFTGRLTTTMFDAIFNRARTLIDSCA
jgi:uracil-DNA glycosylase